MGVNTASRGQFAYDAGLAADGGRVAAPQVQHDALSLVVGLLLLDEHGFGALAGGHVALAALHVELYGQAGFGGVERGEVQFGVDDLLCRRGP